MQCLCVKNNWAILYTAIILFRHGSNFKLTDLSEELRKNPTPDQEERIMREMRKLLDFDVLDPVDTAVFNMLGALGINL